MNFHAHENSSKYQLQHENRNIIEKNNTELLNVLLCENLFQECLSLNFYIFSKATRIIILYSFPSVIKNQKSKLKTISVTINLRTQMEISFLYITLTSNTYNITGNNILKR